MLSTSCSIAVHAVQALLCTTRPSSGQIAKLFHSNAALNPHNGTGSREQESAGLPAASSAAQSTVTQSSVHSIWCVLQKIRHNRSLYLNVRLQPVKISKQFELLCWSHYSYSPDYSRNMNVFLTTIIFKLSVLPEISFASLSHHSVQIKP